MLIYNFQTIQATISALAQQYQSSNSTDINSMTFLCTLSFFAYMERFCRFFFSYTESLTPEKSSVTFSISCICLIINCNLLCACSFKSARYTQSRPTRTRSLNIIGLYSFRCSRCILPHFPIVR